jgi:hypothetical protein
MKRLLRLLCLVGWHSWPRWTRKSVQHSHLSPADAPSPERFYVRICRRCHKRVSRPEPVSLLS